MKPDGQSGFEHKFVPAEDEGQKAVLLMLHGTGGDEDNLLPLGRLLLPGAAILSPRGQVNENGSLRFFRRIREGVFDQEDLARRTGYLERFIADSAARYNFDSRRVVAVGFSNGANIAASLLLRHPGSLWKAVLLSPMVPFELEKPVTLTGTDVFIGAGRSDSMVPAENTEALARMLEKSGARVTIHWDPGGHGITPMEISAARRWLEEHAG